MLQLTNPPVVSDLMATNTPPQIAAMLHAACYDCHSSETRWPYTRHAEITVPSLDDWEKEWEKSPQRNAQPELLPVDFRLPSVAVAESN